jgi:hypothetical protein
MTGIFALANIVLPSRDAHAKDLAIWSFAETCPTLVAPFIAGIVRSTNTASYPSI